jgi:ABC-type antimicrobial peptide transport system permease subunit
MLPFLQALGIRTGREAMAIASEVRRLVTSVDENVSVIEIRTLQDEIDRTLLEDRLVTRLATFFGFVALILACLGLYGNLSYSVARRTREIGIRIAVGAGKRSVLWLVLRDVLILLAIGVAIGVPLAMATKQFAASLVFGLSPLDPGAMIASTLLLAVFAILVGYIPAHRAATMDPVLTLRQE